MERHRCWDLRFGSSLERNPLFTTCRAVQTTAGVQKCALFGGQQQKKGFSVFRLPSSNRAVVKPQGCRRRWTFQFLTTGGAAWRCSHAASPTTLPHHQTSPHLFHLTTLRPHTHGGPLFHSPLPVVCFSDVSALDGLPAC